MIPLAVIRAEPGASASVAAARAQGLEAAAYPLFEVQPAAWAAPAPDAIDALLIGSANALRHGGAALAHYRQKPVYAVGETTAQAAREAGFGVVLVGEGGLQQLLAKVAPEHRRLLRLAGNERITLDPGTCAIIERVVYKVTPLAMPPALRTLLTAGAAVMVHSAAAALRLAAECSPPVRSKVAIALIGPRLLEAAGTGWAAIAVAARPDERALLAAASGLCQERAET